MCLDLICLLLDIHRFCHTPCENLMLNPMRRVRLLAFESRLLFRDICCFWPSGLSNKRVNSRLPPQSDGVWWRSMCPWLLTIGMHGFVVVAGASWEAVSTEVDRELKSIAAPSVWPAREWWVVQPGVSSGWALGGFALWCGIAVHTMRRPMHCEFACIIERIRWPRPRGTTLPVEFKIFHLQGTAVAARFKLDRRPNSLTGRSQPL